MTGEPDLDRLCADYNRRWNPDAFVSGNAVVFYTGRIQFLTIAAEVAGQLQRELDRRGVFAPSFEHVATGTRAFLVTTGLGAAEAHHLRMQLLDRPQPASKITVSRQLVALPSTSGTNRWIVEPAGVDSFPDLEDILRIADAVCDALPDAGGSHG
ncbi:hypothetical protein [Nocardia terpenica]|uniref:Uncharacterized protein n=1 Tax=Nocardia terpenica TaxID=455432 RepID=A0A291REZ2_9NOCA|nr:hypothetical protein [Nocardia terpenica]ATL65870.1 hypothetical protein CRH09_06220 [Nocardia terpenica]